MVMTTLPDRETALQLSRTLVSECLAACVQVIPGLTSTYFWQGELCTDSEHLLLVKTLGANYAALEERLRSLHPYTEPEIIAIPAIAVSQGYLQWAIDSLQRDK